MTIEINIETILYGGTAIILIISITIVLMVYFLYSNLTQTTEKQNCTQQRVSAIAGDE